MIILLIIINLLLLFSNLSINNIHIYIYIIYYYLLLFIVIVIVIIIVVIIITTIIIIINTLSILTIHILISMALLSSLSKPFHKENLSVQPWFGVFLRLRLSGLSLAHRHRSDFCDLRSIAMPIADPRNR